MFVLRVAAAFDTNTTGSRRIAAFARQKRL